MQNNSNRTFTPEETNAWWTGVEKRMSSAGVFCETPDGRLLVTKSNYKKHWSIPGGIIDAGETPKEAAIRETQEEVGVSLAEDNVSFLAIIDRVSDKIGHSYQFIFTAKISEEQSAAINLQEDEIEAYALVTREEVLSENREAGRWFGKAIMHWAKGRSGYIEQTFSYTD